MFGPNTLLMKSHFCIIRCLRTFNKNPYLSKVFADYDGWQWHISSDIMHKTIKNQACILSQESIFQVLHIQNYIYIYQKVVLYIIIRHHGYREQMHGSEEGFNPRHETMLQLWIGLELNMKNLVSRNKKAMLTYLQ